MVLEAYSLAPVQSWNGTFLPPFYLLESRCWCHPSLPPCSWWTWRVQKSDVAWKPSPRPLHDVAWSLNLTLWNLESLCVLSSPGPRIQECWTCLKLIWEKSPINNRGEHYSIKIDWSHAFLQRHHPGNSPAPFKLSVRSFLRWVLINSDRCHFSKQKKKHVHLEPTGFCSIHSNASKRPTSEVGRFQSHALCPGSSWRHHAAFWRSPQKGVRNWYGKYPKYPW